MPFSIDTSGLLDAWVRHYPLDVFPTIWTQMEQAANDGTLLVVDEVVTELGRKDDGAHDWVRAHPTMIVAIDEQIELRVREIMTRYPRLVDTRRLKSGGDPFVIALAWARNLHVITGEMPTGSVERPKIPDVCVGVGIRHLTIMEFFREQHWRV